MAGADLRLSTALRLPPSEHMRPRNHTHRELHVHRSLKCIAIQLFVTLLRMRIAQVQQCSRVCHGRRQAQHRVHPCRPTHPNRDSVKSFPHKGKQKTSRLFGAQAAKSCSKSPGDVENSRGSLRIVSGLAENTNSIFCDGSYRSEAANGCPALQESKEPPAERQTCAAIDPDLGQLRALTHNPRRRLNRFADGTSWIQVRGSRRSTESPEGRHSDHHRLIPECAVVGRGRGAEVAGPINVWRSTIPGALSSLRSTARLRQQARPSVFLSTTVEVLLPALTSWRTD